MSEFPWHIYVFLKKCLQNRTEQISLHVNYTVSCDIAYLYKSNWNFKVNSGTGFGCLINIKGNGWTLIDVT